MANDPNYDFLNDYISKIIDTSDQADNNTDIEQNEFYSSSDEDDDDGSDGINYGVDDNGYEKANEYLADSGDPIDDEGNPLDDDDDDSEGGGYGIPSYKQITGNYPAQEDHPTGDPVRDKLASNESHGDYAALNLSGGGKGAVGKYQFRWNVWKDDIAKVTGIKNRDEFRNNPQAQEKFYSWYAPNYLKPEADKLKKYNKKKLDQDQLEELVHFRGAKGAKLYLQGKVADKPEKYNMSIPDYISRKQRGGMGGGGGMSGVAVSGAAQSRGLNNPSFDSMTFPLRGENTFRGLDSGEPILLEDETGKKKKLKGRHHKVKMKGTVKETRI